MHWRTRLLNPEQKAMGGYQSVVTPTYRGSTVIFDNVGAANNNWRQIEAGYNHGLYGTPTVLELRGLLNWRVLALSREARPNCLTISRGLMSKHVCETPN
jgi:cystathionine beta-lyase/cystathionine gamma-synthase